MIQLVSKGEWKKTGDWLKRVQKKNLYIDILRRYGRQGVEALTNNTPVLTGVTAESWYFDVEEEKGGIYKVVWANRNVVNDWYNVALFIQLGHATGSGVWVEGIDYINPALAPIFNDMVDKVWNEFRKNK